MSFTFYWCNNRRLAFSLALRDKTAFFAVDVACQPCFNSSDNPVNDDCKKVLWQIKISRVEKPRKVGEGIFFFVLIEHEKISLKLKVGLRKNRLMEPRKEMKRRQNCFLVSFKIAQFLFVCHQSPWKFPMNITTKKSR